MFASNLTNLRLTSGLTQQDVAGRLAMSRATYMNLESGKKSPTLDQLNILGKIFEVGTNELIADSYIEATGSVGAELIMKQENKDIVPRDIPTPQVEKLREVLLYVLQKVGAKPNVGETVLYKLLYFIDFDYYEKYGKSITGLTYVRNTYGPTPKLQTFTGVVNAMKKASELDVVETKFFKHTQKKYLPVIEPKFEELSAQELAHIDEELARLGDKTATELSNLSHRDMPWLATQDKKPIEYQLAMYRTTETSVKKPEPQDEL